jgi:hypothetical protein
MRKKLNEWTKFGYKINVLAVIFFISLFLWFNFVSCEDTYIGKSKEEIEQDMIEAVIEVDSLLARVKWMADSLGIHNELYIDAQRINNGSN